MAIVVVVAGAVTGQAKLADDQIQCHAQHQRGLYIRANIDYKLHLGGCHPAADKHHVLIQN